jgi:hypothetical protein
MLRGTLYSLGRAVLEILAALVSGEIVRAVPVHPFCSQWRETQRPAIRDNRRKRR